MDVENDDETTTRGEYVNEKEETISRVDRIYEDYPILSLSQVLKNEYKPVSDLVEGLYRTKFFVLAVQPMNLYEIC